MLEKGIHGSKTLVVDAVKTARAMGSGGLDVFATPALVALMEGTALESLLPHLEAGQGTVGTAISVRHLAATPVGMQVRCESELTAVEGRKLTFTVTAYDEVDKIGEATHERFLIDNARFMQKAQSKLRPDG